MLFGVDTANKQLSQMTTRLNASETDDRSTEYPVLWNHDAGKAGFLTCTSTFGLAFPIFRSVAIL